jgi:integrase
MPKQALTDITLRSLPIPETGQRDIWDAGFPAFGVRVSQGGSKTFVLNIHNSRRSIGRYPIISLGQARAEAKRMLAEKTLGKARPVTISYQQALTLFLEEKQKTRRPNTYKNLKQRLESHFSFKGQLRDATHHELGRRLAKIPSLTEQDHALSVAKTFFTWCHNRRLIDDNPTRGFSPHGHTSRSRVLTDAELQLIWGASDSDDLPAPFRTIVKLLIVAGQRRGETAALRTSYIDGDITTLPATLTKNKREHIFPLPNLAAEILRAVEVDASRNDALFFPARGKPSKPFNGWSKSKAALDKLCGVTDWTLHDLRRTYRTIHARIGTPPHIAERLVNHVSAQTDMERIYDQYRYLPELKLAVANFEKEMTKILEQS